MPSNLYLLLPLVGGYLFIQACYLTRYRAQGIEGYKLVFESAALGLLSVIPARLITEALRDTSLHTHWARWVSGAQHLGTLVLAVLFATGLGFALNLLPAFRHLFREAKSDPRLLMAALRENPFRFWKSLLKLSRESFHELAVQRYGTRLQGLIFEAMRRFADDQQTMLQVTLNSGKVYTGWVTEAPNLKLNEQYLALVPVYSGHRDGELKYHRDLIYPVHEYLDDDSRSRVRRDDFRIILPFGEIVTARLFHDDVYFSYFSPP